MFDALVDALFACCRLISMSMADTTLEKEFAGISASTVSRPKLTKTGKVLLGIAGASFVGMCAVTVPFILPAARRICLPYVPATDTQVQNVMSLLAACKPARLVDLGSGDGRIVLEAAKRGFQVIKQLLDRDGGRWQGKKATKLKGPQVVLSELFIYTLIGCIVVLLCQ